MVLPIISFWTVALNAVLVMLVFIGCVAICLALDARRNDRRLNEMRRQADERRNAGYYSQDAANIREDQIVMIDLRANRQK